MSKIGVDIEKQIFDRPKNYDLESIFRVVDFFAAARAQCIVFACNNNNKQTHTFL